MKNSATPTPTPTPLEAAVSIVVKANESAASLSPVNIFDIVHQEKQQDLTAKVAQEQGIRQKLAQACDMFKEGDAAAALGAKIADDAAIQLYQAMAKGDMSKEQNNALLGDIFGYRVKGELQAGATPTTSGVPSDYSKDGQKASKTPYGHGEHIRKRVLRAFMAHEHLSGRDGGAFFEGLTATSEDSKGNTFGEVMERLNQGQLSIWSSYDYLAKIRSNNNDGLRPAFNPDKVASIVEALSGADAMEVILANPGLIAAYGALRSILNGMTGEAQA